MAKTQPISKLGPSFFDMSLRLGCRISELASSGEGVLFEHGTLKDAHSVPLRDHSFMLISWVLPSGKDTDKRDNILTTYSHA